jgi:hypothetical protein
MLTSSALRNYLNINSGPDARRGIKELKSKSRPVTSRAPFPLAYWIQRATL